MMKLGNEMMEHSFPLKINHLKYVNEHTTFRILFNMVRPFMSTRIRQRMQFYGTNFGKLAETVDKKCLPTEYGGEWLVADDHLTEEQILDIGRKVHEYWTKYPVIVDNGDKK